ncbi:hypothetical protein [Streptomyces mirabilis]|uniref:Uncharacterized protein n=1 Tax=Streptomyces mirabilis TaxID=68239 RepID=A0ABU3UWB2_9ACTN|nr:hypothetical protein [Streptomyces mirabilis]MDU8998224.1 hypothetical protein [Streptomyces mirabilis]
MSTAYDPLHGPDEEPPFAASLGIEVKLARRLLDETATANIHDHTEMLTAAASLNYRMRALLAAIDAERGEGK